MSTSPEICLWVIDALRTNSATPERILSTIRCAPDGKTFCRPCLDRFDSVAKTQTCRSTSPGPEYLTCERERGHPRRHRNQTARATKRWDGGIKTSAVWVEPSDGYVSQGEWDALPKALR